MVDRMNLATSKDEAMVKRYKSLASIPSYTSATIYKHDNDWIDVRVASSVRDSSVNKKRSFVSHVVGRMNDSGDWVKKSLGLLPSDTGDAELVVTSPSGKLQLTVCSVDSKRFIQVTCCGATVFKSLEVTKIHGKPFSDDMLGGFCFNSDESKVVYVASPPEIDNDSKFVHSGDWGEGYSGFGRPSLFIATLTGDNLDVKSVPIPFSASQPLLSDTFVYFIGASESPTQYGIKYCYNRRTALYRVCVDGSGLTRLTGERMNARSPRLSHDAQFIVYLSNPIGGPHHSCGTLVKIQLNGLTSKTVIPVKALPDSSFAGIFTHALPQQCFISRTDGLYVVFQSIYRSKDVIYIVHLDSGVVSAVTDLNEPECFSYTLFDVSADGFILASRSCVNQTSKLLLGRLNSLINVEWSLLHEPQVLLEVSGLLDNIEWKISSVPGRSNNVEVILVQPKDSSKLEGALKGTNEFPLVVSPHGGPHSAFTSSFAGLYSTLLVSAGFAVMFVNFTGSTGFGQDAIKALVGRIGELDVADVHAASLWAIQQPKISKDKVFLMGGSHGGFLTGHLLGKEPTFYKAGILRNPVINVGAMVANSDIPDWCFSEAGLAFEQESPHLLKPSEYELMFSKSPASVAHQISSPVLLMLGAEDRRVPKSEGLRWAQYLRASGKEVDVFMFPNTGHPLDSMDAERVSFDAIYAFLINALSSKTSN